jgi:hypothetical protein
MSLKKLIAEARVLLEDPPRTDQSGVVWRGVYGPHPGLAARTHIVPLRRDIPDYPFHTELAKGLYKLVQDLVLEFPEEPARAVVGKALQMTGFPKHDLTPEDIELLIMATEYLQNGPPPNVSRIGGAPGGPAAHTGSRGTGRRP